MEGGKNPLRVICDTRLRAPLTSRIVQTARAVPTILATACGDAARRAPYEAAGCRVWVLPARDGHVDLDVLMERLGAADIDSVLLEGGDGLFVGNAKGYIRLNLAMPRATVQTGLERIAAAIRAQRADG